MKVGDLITTYNKGFFILEKIERRFFTEDDLRYHPTAVKKVGEEYSPLFHYSQKYDLEGNIKKSRQMSCDSSFCKPAEEYIKKEIERVEKLKLLLC